jgi:hypothetical protein
MSTVRRYRDEDESAVLQLLQQGFGRWPIVEGAGELDPTAFFRWKHCAVPGGPSRMVVAEDGGRVAGFRAFMPWDLWAAGRRVGGLRSADAVTLPALRRSGVFGRIREEAERLHGAPVDIWFGTPNEASRGASAKLGGRTAVGTIGASLQLRPVRAARGLMFDGRRIDGVDAEPAASALADEGAVDELLTDARAGEQRLATVKDARWLSWRYGECPLEYRALRAEGAGRLEGLVIFRLRRRRSLLEAVVEELLVRPGDRRTATGLLRSAARATPAGLVSCGFPPGSTAARAAMMLGFVPWRGGIELMVASVARPISPPPEEIRSWALSLGDLEVV